MATSSSALVARRAVVGVLGLLTLILLAPAPQLKARQQAASAPARELEISVDDGFVLAAVGDCITARPLALVQDPGLAAILRILRGADATFGNFEGSILDIRGFKGYPQAENGGWWLIGPPGIARDLRGLGFKIMSRANNHAMDWGLEGMRETTRWLDEAGIVHAGAGENRAEARAARYLETAKGRVALVSMTASYTELSRAMPPLGQAPARPGLNAIRTTRRVIVTAEMMEALRKIRDAQPEGSFEKPDTQSADKLSLFGVSYRKGDRVGSTYDMNPIDVNENLQSIRQGKQHSDFLIASLHAHAPGNWSVEPADFVPALAHAAIDAGASAFLVQGPHRLRGIEIYKGRPIFYSLANFFWDDKQEPIAADYYEQYGVDPAKATDADLSAMLNAREFNSDTWFRSYAVTCRFEQGQLVEIRLYPLDLGYGMRLTKSGIPRLASAAVGRSILEELQRLSKPYGTTMAIEDNIGVIRLQPSAASSR